MKPDSAKVSPYIPSQKSTETVKKEEEKPAVVSVPVAAPVQTTVTPSPAPEQVLNLAISEDLSADNSITTTQLEEQAAALVA